MIGMIVVVFVLSIVIFIHEFGHFIMAKRSGVRVEKFSLGFGPELLKRKRNDTEYCISAIPLGGYVKLAGDNLEEYKGNSYEYLAKPRMARFKILFFGPLLNYLLGFLCFWLILFVGYPTLTTKVGGLLDGFGAKEAGLEIGDKIVAIDDVNVAYWEDLQKIIQSKKSVEKVLLSILRNNKEYKLEVSVKQKEVSDMLGQKRSVGLLGITPFDEIVIVKHGFIESFVLSIAKTWDLTTTTYKGLWLMLTGKLSMRESMTGPLGIFYLTSKAASMGIVAVLHLVAVLNISIGIFNLLPLPILDGGHIFLLGVEKIRGKHLSMKAENVITKIGLTIIMTLLVFVTYNDVVRLFGDKISKLFK